MRVIHETKEQLMGELSQMRQRVAELEASEAERKKLEHDLRERVKELQCLYSIASMIERPGITLEETYQEVADLLPTSWQYPDIACARVTIGNGEFKTNNYRETRWKQSADINVHSEKAGEVEVSYLEKRPVIDEGPFLKEERLLVDAVAERLGQITERRWAEELYLAIAKNPQIGIYIVQDRRLQLVNSYFQKATGFDEDELLGENPLSLVYPEDREMVRENAVKMLKGQRLLPYEFRVIDKPGNVKSVMEVVTSVRYRGKRATLASYMDITELKKAEEALRESEEKLRLMFDSVTEGIAVTDLGGNILQVNDAVVRMHGYDNKEEIIGRSAFVLIAERDQTRAMENLKKTLEDGYSGTLEYTLLREDGNEFPAELNAALLRGQSSNPTGFVAITRDITERKLAERKTQIANRLATVGQMASGIAHEINNPLTGVIGFAQLLQRKDVPGDIKSDVKIIHDSAQRVASIVGRLLVFARQQKPERKSLSVNETIAATVAMRAYEMETNDINVAMQLAPDLPHVMADSGQLQQVFLNIILNAEAEMKLAHGKGNLRIKTETIDNIIRISFKDDGPGIPKENLERVFDPFFTTREVGEGTGLGLSICHGIVAEHGGRMYAQSEPGRGATFTVELPVVTEAEGPELAEPAAEEAEIAAKAKILVVDDEPVVQQFLSEILTEAGYQVESADNASDALEKLESNRYSLILLDIKMHGMSGIELYKHLQKTSQSLAKRVVFITGDVMGTDTWNFLRKTKAPYLTKPFSDGQLGKEINRLLRQSA